MDGRRRGKHTASIFTKLGALELVLSPPSAGPTAAAAITAAVVPAPFFLPKLLLQGLPGCNGFVAPLILPPLLHFEHPLAAGQGRAEAGHAPEGSVSQARLAFKHQASTVRYGAGKPAKPPARRPPPAAGTHVNSLSRPRIRSREK